ncbi:MAG: type II secretion system protein [Verrucomicrobiales bacterium]|nr:type II secretion system protein [Verrucomicrobiales bacterium]
MSSIVSLFAQKDHRRGRGGFSMIEMIGVLAIVSILAGMVGPNLIRRVIESNAAREAKTLQTLADGLSSHVQAWQTIPGSASWVTNVSSSLGLSPTDVAYSDPANPAGSGRVYLIHPAFTPSNGTDPLFTSSASGSVAPTNARILIISCTKRGLTIPVTSGKAANTAGNRNRFDNIWNWSLNPFTKAPPTGWPAAWNGNGHHLHVQRINLAPHFFRLTVSNPSFPGEIPFAQFNQNPTFAFDVTNAVDAYYLRGTVVRFYRHDTPYTSPPANPDELNLVHTVQGPANFIYDGIPSRWRLQ